MLLLFRSVFDTQWALKITTLCTAWIHQKGQIEIMTFLACLFDANQLLL